MDIEVIGSPAGRAHECNLSRPVDLVHLFRYTLGERSLEIEVLELFYTQSDLFLERLRETPGDQQWKDAAHSLKGSAKAIGAWRIAGAAERAESLSGASFGETRDARLRELEFSVNEAKAYIRSLL